MAAGHLCIIAILLVPGGPKTIAITDTWWPLVASDAFKGLQNAFVAEPHQPPEGTAGKTRCNFGVFFLPTSPAWLVRSSDDDAKVMLAESFYRRDDFQKAAASLSGVEVATNKLIISQYPTLNVAKLESFKGQMPYDVIGEGQNTCLRFLNADPLPLVTVRVNAATRSPSLSTPGFRRSR